MQSVPSPEPSTLPGLTVLIGTGGTIAGTARSANDNVGYTAGSLGVADLIAAVPALADIPLECEQCANLDSKDMSHAVWASLAQRIEHHLQRPEVSGIVVTHGTDTLEETAYLLDRTVAARKPVVLVAAMRPATSMQADGPQNLSDACTLARTHGARGVMAVMAGGVWAGREVRKIHAHRLSAFGSADAAPLARIEEGRVRRLRAWPAGGGAGASLLSRALWPDVQIVTSHGGADGRLVDLLVKAGAAGIVVAGTGNATVHHAIEAALDRAVAAGVVVARATRVGGGRVLPVTPGLPATRGHLTPAQLRVALMLDLLGVPDAIDADAGH